MQKMRTKVNNASAVAFSKNLKERGPIPHRGQIKMKIAAKAIQSLVSIMSSSSSHHLGTPRKRSYILTCYLRPSPLSRAQTIVANLLDHHQQEQLKTADDQMIAEDCFFNDLYFLRPL
ncbi:B-block binding subunit of TFIIIC [Striga asiatica]|uniref:B-block binding subunit of TFIIIC n=1 Tax=Striga asiatica TaxID=4170 RepID=A0A5A7P222_STRAF|nr:B-block binding subunit of TFIIIC [Striga asiatica]